jgi:predicted nuclease with TOPRIM domain
VDEPSDEMQYNIADLDLQSNVRQIDERLNQLSDKFDRMNEVIIHLNRTVGRLRTKLDQQTLNQQRENRQQVASNRLDLRCGTQRSF